MKVGLGEGEIEATKKPPELAWRRVKGGGWTRKKSLAGQI